MHIMHIGFPKVRVMDTVLRVLGDHMMAHKRPSFSCPGNSNRACGHQQSAIGNRQSHRVFRVAQKSSSCAGQLLRCLFDLVRSLRRVFREARLCRHEVPRRLIAF